MSRKLFTIAAALIVALLPAVIAAQAGTGTITGIVRDLAGISIPGATVRIVNEDTAAIVVLVTDAQGSYRAAALAPGRYRVETSIDGFETDARRVVLAGSQTSAIDVTLASSRFSDSVVVTARRVEEPVQDVPIPVSVVNGTLAADTGAFNVNRLKELIPTVQFYSTNPRNSSVNVRGLGAPFGLTNDGIEPGVGLYVDGIFYARPASATLDFLDVERIEVLRGPQGTLFGKNTTAGAISVTTRKPSFTPETDFELNYGSVQFVQAKASITGPIGKRAAARLSFSGTQRDGTVYNTTRQDYVNDLNNVGVRGSLLLAASDKITVTVAVDNTRQRPDGYTQVVAGVAPTLRPANRQYPQIAADLGYTAPSFNAFDRKTDVDTPLRSYQDLGGGSATVEREFSSGQVTSTTAWRYWNWNPSSDRDFIGLPVTTISAAPSKQRQWTQEVRYAGDVSPHLSLVVGVFGFRQSLDSDPAFKQEQGSAAARFLLAPTPSAATPGLLDGYGFNQTVTFRNVSAAAYGQVSWAVTDRLRLLPGLRFNYDQKDVAFDQQVYGGLQTTDPALIALQQSIFAPQAYRANVDDNNLSGQLTAAYKVSTGVNLYATYATGFKSVGLNLNGVPADAQNQPILSAATVKPEDVRNLEIGVKSQPFRGVTANITAYDTEVRDFQTQVVNADVGVLRGYLANADKARVRGVEFDGSARLNANVSIYGAAAYTDGRYISFPDAPPPLEQTGGPSFVDISGSVLPGISRWAASAGAEYLKHANWLGRSGDFFSGLDASYRSSFSSSATASKYLVVAGYPLLNARIGFHWRDGWTFSVWSRNVLNREYFELLTAAPGNTGLYVGQPGDYRTFGVTLRVAVK